MAIKKYQAKNSCKRVIPFWVNDVVGKDNYKELQRGNSVSLSTELKRGIFEFLVEVPAKSVAKKATPKKKKEK
tara:strand:+ start:473 stop:691 length:219 start_codon:yes stop_codon:yes gene_type:complete